MVFRKQAVQRLVFQKFWNNLPLIHNLEEYRHFVEYKMTYDFEKAGMSWCVYSDVEDWEASTRKNDVDQILLSPKRLIEGAKIPVLSKHSFTVKREVSLSYNNGLELSDSMKYIKENTWYDEQLIYQYFIKNYNIYDLRDMFNQYYILTEERRSTAGKRIAVYAHLFYDDLFQTSVGRLKAVPDTVDIYVTTDTEKKKREIESLLCGHRKGKVLVVEPRGREWSAFLIVMKKYLEKYDYFCMIHDKKSSQMYYETVGSSYCDILWDNLLWNEGYIRAVIHLFEEHPEIGLFVPPEAYHGTYFYTAIDYWTICLEKTKELAARLDIDVPFDAQKPPLSLGGAFWCRSESIKKLLEFEFQYEDFAREPMPVDGTISHALERILPYVAQDAGFYTGTIMNPEYAASDILNKQYIIRSILRQLRDTNAIPVITLEETLNALKCLPRKRRFKGKR